MATPDYILSASLVCGDMMRLGEQVKQLEAGGIDYIHFDVMDGHFVHRLGLHPEILEQVRAMTDLPIDVHMMVSEPERYNELFIKAGADIVAIHVEGNDNLHRTIKQINDLGGKAGVVLNMATPLSTLDYILDDIHMIMLMGINPGVVGHKIIPTIYQKISDVREKIKNHPHILLEIDGGVTPETLPKMIEAGANMFVCGTSTIFRPPSEVDKKIGELRMTIDSYFA